MTDPNFDHFCAVVKTRSGIILTLEKAYLVNSRLLPIARSEGLSSVPELLARLKQSPPEELTHRCVEAMATHESSFFRDGTPFNQLVSDVLPNLINNRRSAKTLRIWCAACSSGQEPYTLAIIIKEMGHQVAGWNFEIVATDMSASILQKAKRGVYSDFEVKRGLSEERLGRWFTRHDLGWEISPTLKAMVQFRSHNLLNGGSGMGVFDLILCRNVLIYFELERKRQILESLSGALARDGVLYLGSAETIIGVSSAFQTTPDARGQYRRSNI